MARTNTTTQKATSGKVVADNFSNTQKKSAAKTDHCLHTGTWPQI